MLWRPDGGGGGGQIFRQPTLTTDMNKDMDMDMESMGAERRLGSRRPPQPTSSLTHTHTDSRPDW
jgi:hypothetical protein